MTSTTSRTARACRRTGRVLVYRPAGLDLWERKGPPTGTRVVLVQPRGCPRNGTMGHAYLADADTGEFYGLRLLASLHSATEPTPADEPSGPAAPARRTARAARPDA